MDSSMLWDPHHSYVLPQPLSSMGRISVFLMLTWYFFLKYTKRTIGIRTPKIIFIIIIAMVNLDTIWHLLNYRTHFTVVYSIIDFSTRSRNIASLSYLFSTKPGISLIDLQRLTLKPVRICPISSLVYLFLGAI